MCCCSGEKATAWPGISSDQMVSVLEVFVLEVGRLGGEECSGASRRYLRVSGLCHAAWKEHVASTEQCSAHASQRAQSDPDAHTNTSGHTHGHTHTHTHTRGLAHTNVDTHMDLHTNGHTLMWTNTHTQMETDTHGTYTHTWPHTHGDTHTHTRVDTHTDSVFLPCPQESRL